MKLRKILMNQKLSKREKGSLQVAKEFHLLRRFHRSKAILQEDKNPKK
jgi:hypothetical protein